MGRRVGRQGQASTRRAGPPRCGSRYSQLRFQKARPARVGHQLPARDPAPQRGGLPRLPAARRRAGFVSRFPDLVGLENVHAGAHDRAAALRHRQGASSCATRAATRSTTAREYTPDAGVDLRMGARQQAHAQRHGQPGLRPGRGRPGGREPERRRDVLPGEAAVLRRGLVELQLRPAGRERLLGLQLAASRRSSTAAASAARRRAARRRRRATSDVPVGTTILGAAKLTGKLAPSMNFGTLHALTGAARTRRLCGAIRRPNEVRGRAAARTTASMRAPKEFKEPQRTGSGCMVTAASAAFDERRARGPAQQTTALMAGYRRLDVPRQAARTGWSRAGRRRRTCAATQARITSVQQNSRHYFQRPDADHVEVDPTRTSLTRLRQPLLAQQAEAASGS